MTDRPHRFTNCIDCYADIDPSEVQPRCKRCAGIKAAAGHRWPRDGARGCPTLDIQEGNWEEWH